jgi:hypothetical protein
MRREAIDPRGTGLKPVSASCCVEFEETVLEGAPAVLEADGTVVVTALVGTVVEVVVVVGGTDVEVVVVVGGVVGSIVNVACADAPVSSSSAVTVHVVGSTPLGTEMGMSSTRG